MNPEVEKTWGRLEREREKLLKEKSMLSTLVVFLNGKKTIIIAIVGAVLAILESRGIFKVPQEVWILMGAAGVAALRDGIRTTMASIKDDLNKEK